MEDINLFICSWQANGAIKLMPKILATINTGRTYKKPNGEWALKPYTKKEVVEIIKLMSHFEKREMLDFLEDRFIICWDNKQDKPVVRYTPPIK